MNSVKYNFIRLKNEMESYVRIGGRGLKNLTYPYMVVVGVKNCKHHPYVINESPLMCKLFLIVSPAKREGDGYSCKSRPSEEMFSVSYFVMT